MAKKMKKTKKEEKKAPIDIQNALKLAMKMVGPAMVAMAEHKKDTQIKPTEIACPHCKRTITIFERR